MRFVPPLAFFAGAVLTLTAALVLAGIFLGGWHKPATGLSQSPKLITAPLAQATNPETLRQACLSIARTYEAQAQLLELQAAEVERLFQTLVWMIAGIGFTLGPLCLYIYTVTRKLPPGQAGRA